MADTRGSNADEHKTASATDGSSLARRFRAAWVGAGDPATARPELLPTRLTRVCVDVLPVDGAGISVYDDNFRLPLGASDDITTMAEALQFTHGAGPCLEAAEQHQIVLVTSEDIERRWPAFASELFGRTAYRAIISLPIVTTTHASGAIDLYLSHSSEIGSVSLADAMTVAGEVTLALRVAQATTPLDTDHEDARSYSELIPTWMHTDTADTRAAVWIAAGMVMERLQVSAGDALSVLRGYAYSRGAVLDDSAGELLNGDVTLDDVLN